MNEMFDRTIDAIVSDEQERRNHGIDKSKVDIM
jgi:hypothetical protein